MRHKQRDVVGLELNFRDKVRLKNSSRITLKNSDNRAQIFGGYNVIWVQIRYGHVNGSLCNQHLKVLFDMLHGFAIIGTR